MKNKWAKFAAIVGFFIVLTVIFTYPAAFNLTTHLVSEGGDGYQNLWNIWWFKKSIFELGQSPYFTHMLHAPEGITLLLHTLSPVNIILSLPFGFLINDMFGYNIVVLFSFVASGVTMFYLAYYLTKNDYAAIVAGVIFSFSAYHFAHAAEHINLLSIQWVPLFILYLLKVFKEGGIKNAVFMGLSLVLIAFAAWIYVVYSLMLGFLLFLWNFRNLLKEKKKFLYLGFSALIFLILVGPLIYKMMEVVLGTGLAGVHTPDLFNADVVAYFVPGFLSTFIKFFNEAWEGWMYSRLEASLYLGYIALALGIFALFKVKKARKWGIFALIFFILSLGTTFRIFGMNFDIPMPYELFENIPFLNISGVTQRYGFLVNFSLAIMVAYAISYLQKPFLKKFKNKIIRITVPVLIVLLILIENLSIPFPVTQINVPDFYYQMANDTEQYTILDVPMHPELLYFQIIHQKPMIGGYVSRMPHNRHDFLRHEPIIQNLYFDHPYEEIQNPGEIFTQHNIKYVILHEDKHLDYVQNVLELELVYDKEMKVFDTGIERGE